MSTSNQDPRTRQQSTSHILKTGKRGNPFVKDTHDLFSTLVASLQLTTNTRFFRSYPNSFTTDDAAANLSSLRFSQSNRSTDPNDPSRIVTTTTTTTFSMNREIAKGICQHFMDARLIENAADPLNPTFKERGIYQITPKGLHVLERFITKNGIHADHLVRVFTTQPICMKLLHLERRPTDDEIHITPNVINVLFKRFSGARTPNYVSDPTELQRNTTVRPFTDNPRLTPNYDRSLGVELQDVRERAPSGTTLLVKHVFSSTVAIDWLVDFSTCCGREEAAELLAHFVRYGLITLHIDRSKSTDKVAQAFVRAPPSEPTIPGISLEGQYKYGAKVTYRITDEGRRLSGVDGNPDRAHYNLAGGATNRTSEDDLQSVSHHHHNNHNHQSYPPPKVDPNGGPPPVSAESDGRQVLRDILQADNSDGSAWVRDATSSSARLKAILGEPALRSLFRDFLRSHICEENLHYWIDVQEFRRRFATSSTAVGVGSAHNSKKKNSSSAATAMEQHQQKLVSTALLIFNTYLAPGSPSELNIDHNLRADVISYMSRAVDEAKGTPNSPDPAEGSVPALRATQVQALLRHYERIADHIYRLMATDQVPKFVRTERFLEILSAQQLDESRDTEATTTTMTSGYGSEQALIGPSTALPPRAPPTIPTPAGLTNTHPPPRKNSPATLDLRLPSSSSLLKHPSSYTKKFSKKSSNTATTSSSSTTLDSSSHSSPESPLANHPSSLRNNLNHLASSFAGSNETKKKKKTGSIKNHLMKPSSSLHSSLTSNTINRLSSCSSSSSISSSISESLHINHHPNHRQPNSSSSPSSPTTHRTANPLDSLIDSSPPLPPPTSSPPPTNHLLPSSPTGSKSITDHPDPIHK